MINQLDAIKQHTSALYELLKEGDNFEANNHLRKLIYQLEMMDEASSKVPESARTLASWLVQLCDAEHGALIKKYPDQPNGLDHACIDAHIKEQQQQLHSGATLHTKVEQGIKHLAGMMGVVEHPSLSIADRIPWFANILLEHLREDQEMGQKLHQLALATTESLRSAQEMLIGTSDNSPELRHVSMMLSHPVPTDPVQARDYLKQISAHLEHIQQQMIKDNQQMQRDIGDRVNTFKGVSNKLMATEKKARSDTLTGLPNRAALIDFLNKYSKQSVISLFIIAIDQLQEIKAASGENTGNRCLCEVANVLTSRVRASDMIFRAGSNEFVILLPGISNERALLAAHDLHKSITLKTIVSPKGDIDVHISLGLAQRSANEQLYAWIKRADAALYVAKSNGGNHIEAAP
ncbi:MAG: GGDEF domain-containing protein [Mariprofundus sp.]|nr:GGDEF domain-containing protein [Mariprofundus sp.]